MKKIIIAVIVFVVLAGAAVGGYFIYESGRPEREMEAFKSDLLGTWSSGSYEIAEITFNEDGKTVLEILGIDINGVYEITRDEADRFIINLRYDTILGISVSRDYYASVSDTSLNLSDVKAGTELQYNRITPVAT